jgi:hypothetical protein
VLVITAILILAIGIYPELIVGWAHH